VLKSISDNDAMEDKASRDDDQKRELKDLDDGKVPYLDVVGHSPSGKAFTMLDALMLASLQDAANKPGISPVGKVLYELACQDLERYPKLVRSCSPKIVHLESAGIGPRYG
jgi:hypothetical protein